MAADTPQAALQREINRTDCTGHVTEVFGLFTVHHDGDTCPIHESAPLNTAEEHDECLLTDPAPDLADPGYDLWLNRQGEKV